MNYHCDKCGQHFPLCETCEKEQAITTSVHGFTTYLCAKCARKLTLYLREQELYTDYILFSRAYDYISSLKSANLDVIAALKPVFDAETEVDKLIDQWIKDNRKKATVLKLVPKAPLEG